MSYAYFKWTFVLLLIFVCQNSEAVEECDFLQCVKNATSFIFSLRREGSSFSCRKFLNMSGCSDYCMHKYYPNIFLHPDTNLNNYFAQYCIENIAHFSNVNWSCIARHSFRLLTCLSNMNTMISNNVREDEAGKVACRKSLEFSNCPSDVLLSDCGVNSVEVVKDMLQFAIEYFMPSSCKGKSIKKVFSMPVHYSLGKEFMEVARCFDAPGSLLGISSCFKQRIQTEMDLHAFLCGDDYLTDCVHFEVAKACKDVSSVRTYMLKLFSFGGIRCQQSQFAFTDLSSHQFQDSVTPSNNEMHTHTYPPLNDEIYDFKNIHADESTEPVSVYSVADETRHEIDPGVTTKNQPEEKDTDADNLDDASSFDFKKVHASNSFLKNPSENPSYKDGDYFKASSSVAFYGDRTLLTVALLLIILIF